MAEIMKYIDLEVLGKTEQWIYDYLSAEDAKALKTVSLSADGRYLNVYRQTNPTAETTPAFSIELPTPDLTNVMMKVMSATPDNVATFGTNGSVKDSGVKIGDLAVKSEVAQQIATAISQSQHMKKQVVTTLPSAASASENVFYLLKKESVTGADKYEIYLKINDELVMIDDTSMDLSGYVTTQALGTALAQVKKEALEAAAADAATKADNALAAAKSYTDGKISSVNTTLNSLGDRIDKAETTLTAYGNRITNVENKVNNISTATEEEALAVFNSIFRK